MKKTKLRPDYLWVAVTSKGWCFADTVSERRRDTIDKFLKPTSRSWRWWYRKGYRIEKVELRRI